MFLLLKQVAGSSRFGFGSFASFLATFLMVSACGGGGGDSQSTGASPRRA